MTPQELALTRLYKQELRQLQQQYNIDMQTCTTPGAMLALRAKFKQDELRLQTQYQEQLQRLWWQ
jgi:uncharacterized pyridoxamine 5'-phosphate oxidase family protein